MYHFWKNVYHILRNCLAYKFGERLMARGMMINSLYHMYSVYEKKKQIDLLDYMWHEIQVVVADNRVPIYCPLLQRLINTKMLEAIVQQFPQVLPSIVVLPLLLRMPLFGCLLV